MAIKFKGDTSVAIINSIKKAEAENDTDKLLNAMRRYGKKTREEACRMLIEKAAEEKGMTIWEYTKWLNEDKD